MDLNARPVQQADFHSEVLDKEVILYFPAGGRFLYLNQTAALVWERCNGSQTAEEIIQSLQATFPESAAEIRADVQETLQSFLTHGCIRLE